MKELLSSELKLALKAQDSKSVRALIEALDMKLNSFIKLINACGYQLVLEKYEK